MIHNHHAHLIRLLMFCTVVVAFLIYARKVASQALMPLTSPAAQQFRRNTENILFANDQYEDSPNPAALEPDVACLKARPEVRIPIDGNTDNGGSIIDSSLVLAQKVPRRGGLLFLGRSGKQECDR
jgi:hypothetical protein